MRTSLAVGALMLVAVGVYLLQGTSTPEYTTALLEQTNTAPMSHNTAVSSDEFEALLQAGNALLVDVRTEDEYVAGRLPDATLVDFTSPDFLDQFARLPKEGTYALYCRSGNRSGQARELLAQAGFMHVVDLAGGVKDWQASGRMLCTDC